MSELIDNKQKELNDLIASNGWLVVEELFKKEIQALESISNIDDTQPLEKQAVQIKANKEIINKLNSIMSQIKSQARMEKLKKTELI